MAKTMPVVKALPTIWRYPDDRWTTMIRSLLRELDLPAKTGCPRCIRDHHADGLFRL